MVMNQTKRWLLMMSVLLLALMAYFTISVAESYADTTTYSVKVTSSTLNVRSGPSTTYAIVGKLTIGQTVQVLETLTNGSLKWYKITYNAKTAYIASTYTKLLSQTVTFSPTKVGKFQKATYARSGPFTTSPSIGTFAAGVETTLYSTYKSYLTTTNNIWYRVSLNGKVAYVPVEGVSLQPTVQTYTTPVVGLSIIDTVCRTSPSSTGTVAGTIEQNSLVTATGIVTTYTTGTMNKWYIMSYNGATAYVYAGHVRIVSTDDATAFEAYMTAQGFPESYKPYLRGLHATNPKWIFKAQLTGLDWTAALAKEQVVGRSLLSSSTSDAWKSFEDGAYNFTTNTWVNFDAKWNAADNRVVAYYFDPRNFLTQKTVYQFLDHSFDANSQNLTTIRAIAYGSFLSGTTEYATWIYNAGKAAGVNPNVLTSMIRQEQGTSGTSGLISGTYPGYVGLYNFFNINAYAAGGRSAVENGLIYARGGNVPYATTYGRPWTSKEKAISGGAQYYGINYVSKKQNTLYLKKFNVLNGLSAVGTHQYMTHILGAASEATTLGTAYATSANYPLVFCIPVYNNMPATVAPLPGTDGNNDNLLNSLKVVDADTEVAYAIKQSAGTDGFTRYGTSYTVSVPSTVSKIIVNGVGHNNISYVNAGYVTAAPLYTNLPAGFQNIGSTTRLATVTASPNLPIYTGTGTTFSTLGSYATGIRVSLLDKSTAEGKTWYKVSFGGDIGYIDASGIGPILTIKYYSAWIKGTTTASLNVRASASTAGTLKGSMGTGTVFGILGEVITTDGSKWYMMSYYGATITGNGVYQLSPGTNVIKVTVKATTGVTRTYTITVVKN